MTSFDTNNAYKVTWSANCSFDRLKVIDLSKLSSAMRLATIQVQKQRVCLVADYSGYRFVPYEYINSVWKPVNTRDIRVEKVTPEMFESEEIFNENLKRQMMLQFKESVMGFYSDLPGKDEILRVISANPKKSTMREARYTFYKARVAEDPEFDGAFEVHCSDGTLIVPYVGNPDEDPELLVKYANYIKGSDATSRLNRLGRWLDSVVGFVGNIHWSDFRTMLEGVWHTNG